MSDINLRATLEALIASAAYRLDHHAGAGFGAYFAPDGSYDAIGTVLTGPVEIERYYRERDLGPGLVARHSFTNFTILEATDNRASGISMLTAFAGSGSGPHAPVPVLVCDVRDDFVRDNAGRWLIEKRVLQPIFGAVASLKQRLAQSGSGD